MSAARPLAGFLDSLDFNYFATFTTRKPIALKSTRRLAQRVGGHIGAGEVSTYFWCAEEFDVRDGYHFHALIDMPHDPKLISSWYERSYGRCQIITNTKPGIKKAASWYVSKYITKGVTDWDIYFRKKAFPNRNPSQKQQAPWMSR